MGDGLQYASTANLEGEQMVEQEPMQTQRVIVRMKKIFREGRKCEMECLLFFYAQFPRDIFSV